MSNPFTLIVLSSEGKVDNEVQIVSELFSCGLSHFHLRKYTWNETEMEKFISVIPGKFHNRITIHSNFSLETRFNLRGIHLNDETRSKFSNYENNKVVSTSFHSLKEIEENICVYEYVFLSPVFDSISKSEYKTQIDFKSIENYFQLSRREQLKTPQVIALGGIEANNIRTIKQAGFSGAALLGAIWNSKDPVKSFQEIQSKVN